jgi:hypothetical protein
VAHGIADARLALTAAAAPRTVRTGPAMADPDLERGRDLDLRGGAGRSGETA